jgi:hypothetical protein
LALAVGAGEVEGDATIGYSDRRLEADGLVGMAVVVERILGRVDALGQRRQGTPRAPLGVGEELGDEGVGGVDGEAFADLDEPARA